MLFLWKFTFDDSWHVFACVNLSVQSHVRSQKSRDNFVLEQKNTVHPFV